MGMNRNKTNLFIYILRLNVSTSFKISDKSTMTSNDLRNERYKNNDPNLTETIVDMTERKEDDETSIDHSTASDDHRIEIQSNEAIHQDSREEDQIPLEFSKLIVAIIFLFFSLGVTVFSLSVTHDRTPKDPPLPDIILSNIPNQHWAFEASEYLILALTAIGALLLLFHKHRIIILRRICLLVGLHYIYRAITFAITVLPNPNTDMPCYPTSDNVTWYEIFRRFVKLSIAFGFSINSGGETSVYCGDYIYSGHAVSLITAYLVIEEYAPKRWILLRWMAFLSSATGVCFILLGRGHYSVDVLIAYWMTTRIWWMYHTLAKHKTMKNMNYSFTKRSDGTNYLKRIWWWHFFRYFELNVPSNLEYKFDWPMPQRMKQTRIIQYLNKKLFSHGQVVI